jgi:hypothetical protein
MARIGGNPFMDGPREVTFDAFKRPRYPSPQIVWNTRDDENYVRKAAVTSMYSGGLATLLAIGDINLFPHKNPGLVTALSRMKLWYVPFIGSTLAYTTAVRFSASVRNKNDPVNHLYAGWATGMVIGKCTRSVLTGFLSGFFLGIAGFMAKDFAMDGVDIRPPVRPHKRMGNAISHQLDWTLFPEPQGFWVRSKDDPNYEKLRERGQIGTGEDFNNLFPFGGFGPLGYTPSGKPKNAPKEASPSS